MKFFSLEAIPPGTLVPSTAGPRPFVVTPPSIDSTEMTLWYSFRACYAALCARIRLFLARWRLNICWLRFWRFLSVLFPSYSLSLFACFVYSTSLIASFASTSISAVFVAAASRFSSLVFCSCVCPLALKGSGCGSVITKSGISLTPNSMLDRSLVPSNTRWSMSSYYAD